MNVEDQRKQVAKLLQLCQTYRKLCQTAGLSADAQYTQRFQKITKVAKYAFEAKKQLAPKTDDWQSEIAENIKNAGNLYASEPLASTSEGVNQDALASLNEDYKPKNYVYYSFNEEGTYIDTTGEGKAVLGAVIKTNMEASKENILYTFKFNDLSLDRSLFENKNFKLVQNLDDKVDTITDKAAADAEYWTAFFKENDKKAFPKFRAIARSSKLGEMDFVQKSGLLSDNEARYKLFLINKVAYNWKDAGNFFWGVTMKKLDVSLFVSQMGAHYNNHKNGNIQNDPTKDANYEKQKGLIRWDSKEDQQAIKNGHKFQRKSEKEKRKAERAAKKLKN